MTCTLVRFFYTECGQRAMPLIPSTLHSTSHVVLPDLDMSYSPVLSVSSLFIIVSGILMAYFCCNFPIT